MSTLLIDYMSEPLPWKDTVELFNRENLLRRCMGNESLVERVLTTFTVTFENDLKKIDMEFADGDVESFAKTAHKMKGSAGNAGAMTLSEIAKSLETFARQDELGELPDLIAELHSEFETFTELIRASV